MMEHGADFWGVAGRNAEFGMRFNEGVASDSRFVVEIVVRDVDCSEAFACVRSLLDVGGGDGTMTKAIVAEPSELIRIKCINHH